MALRKQIRELEAEKKKLSIANRKSEWYRKKSSSPESDDPERQDVESVNLESHDLESQDHDSRDIIVLTASDGLPSPRSSDSPDMLWKWLPSFPPVLYSASEVSVESDSSCHPSLVDSLPVGPLLQEDQ